MKRLVFILTRIGFLNHLLFPQDFTHEIFKEFILICELQTSVEGKHVLLPGSGTGRRTSQRGAKCLTCTAFNQPALKKSISRWISEMMFKNAEPLTLSTCTSTFNGGTSLRTIVLLITNKPPSSARALGCHYRQIIHKKRDSGCILKRLMSWSSPRCLPLPLHMPLPKLRHPPPLPAPLPPLFLPSPSTFPSPHCPFIAHLLF